MKSSAAIVLCVVLCVGCKPTAKDVAVSPMETARAYAAALQDHDFVRFQILFEESRRKYLSERTFRLIAVTATNVDVLSTPEKYPSIQYSVSQGHDGRTANIGTGSIYVTSSGKIKYDPIFCIHPAFGIDAMISQLESDDIRMRDGGLSWLTKWHIPTFGFVSGEQKQQRDGHITEIKSWWLDNRGTYDLGEPRLPLSPVDLQTLEKQQTQAAAQFPPSPSR